MVEKEAGDLVREKRFGGWALTFLAFWTLFLVFTFTEGDAYYRRDYPMSVDQLGEVAFFFYAIAFVVLALFILSDGISKERESGMLPLVGAKPITRANVLIAKALSGGLVYVASFLVSLLPAFALAVMMGMPAVELIVRLYVGPFLILYLFLLGVGLLLGVVASSSKVAIGTAAGVYLPLFFLMTNGPLSSLFQSYPILERISSYTPFSATFAAVRTVVHGGQMPWVPIVVVIAVGIACGVAAFLVYSRQEVARA